jgi:hypothetical protein
MPTSHYVNGLDTANAVSWITVRARRNATGPLTRIWLTQHKDVAPARRDEHVALIEPAMLERHDAVGRP